MLARSTRLELPGGGHLDTPLLVPSLSSKGFPTLRQSGRDVSEAQMYLRLAAPHLNETLLVSAYDLHYGHLPDVDRFQSGFLQSIYSNPKLLIIDSGGYEKSRDYDAGSLYRYPFKSKRWGAGKLGDLLDSFAPEVTGAIVNFDGRGSYDQQIADSQAFMARWPRFLSVFLLKPEPRAQFIDVDRLHPHAQRLRAFSALGVTEKELGSTLLDRAVRVAGLRRMLDSRDVHIPIHLFGSLDTVFTPLYFLSGAEIFDGLTWLRYAYRKGLTIYGDSLALMEQNLTLRDDQRLTAMVVQNLHYLARLKTQMHRYVAEEDIAVFEEVAPTLQQSISAVQAAVGGGGS